MREGALTLDNFGEVLQWHLPEDRSTGAIPDNFDFWQFLQKNRDNISGVAHSHPGSGIPHPSHTDVTTFSAIELGLGVRWLWWICSSDELSAIYWVGPEKYDYHVVPVNLCGEWVDLLREYSYERG
jgi:hypothetical protein